MIRHKLIINPKFQYSFIFYTLVFTLFSLGVFYFSCIYFFSELQKLGVDLKLPKDHVFFKFANLQQNKMLNITGVVTGVVLLCQISFGILYSHKIAGPLYRFTKVIKGSDKTSKKDHVFFKFANLQQNKMLNITGVVTGVVLLCQISFGILYSHKIAGPLYRFTKVLKGSDKTSKVDNFTVRPNDYFPEVYEAFNHFSSVKSLRKNKEDEAA